MSKKTSKQLLAQRDRVIAQIEKMGNEAKAEERELTVAELAERDQLSARVGSIEARAVRRKAEEKQEKRDKAAAARNGLGIGNIGASNASGVRVRSEARTYEKGNGQSYLYDLCALAMGPGLGSRYFSGMERIQRHAVENHVEATELDSKPESSRSDAERYFLRQMVEAKNKREDNRGRAYSYRALSTASGAGGEFVPPMYDTARWIAYMRAGRVVADNCHHEDLPDGTMSINYPKVSGGTSVATQGAQNTNVSQTTLETEYVTVPVYTKAGSQIVSLQLLERSPIAFDEMVFADLAKAYAQNVDVAVVNGSGTKDVTGILNTSSINTVTWTQATPTLKGLYGQIGLAKTDIATKLFLPATHQFMTPKRWEWIGQTFDTQNRPVVVPAYNGPFNAIQVAPDAATAEGAVGRTLSGLHTFEDANIPADLGATTTQDLVLVGRMTENWLFESSVITRALPQTYGAQLSVLLQLYGYIAFSAARYPTANSVITGTGLKTPTFNS